MKRENDLSYILIECKNELYQYIRNYREIINKDSKQGNYGNSARQVLAIMNKYGKESNIFKESILHLISICINKENNYGVGFLKAFRKEGMNIDIIKSYFSDSGHRTVERGFKNILKQFAFKFYFFEETGNEQLLHNLFMYFIVMKYEELTKIRDFNFEKNNDSKFFRSFMGDLDGEEDDEEKTENSNSNEITSKDIDIIENRNNERKNEKRKISIEKHMKDILNESGKKNKEDLIILLQEIKNFGEEGKDLEFIRVKLKEVLGILKNNYEGIINKEIIEDYVKDSLINNKSEYGFILQGGNFDFLIRKLINSIEEDDIENIKFFILLGIYYTLEFDGEFLK